MLGQLIARILTGEAGIYFTRLRTLALYYTLMAAAGAGVAFFLLLALFVWLTSWVGALNAALIFAGACALVAVAFYILVAIARKPAKEASRDRLNRDIASIAGVAAMTNLPQLLQSARRRKRLLAVPVALAGIWGAFRLALIYRRR